MASLRKHGKVWYYRFVDADGVKRERKGCPDRRVTEEMARKAETEVAKIRDGLSDPKAERMAREGRRPIREHAAEFIAFMESKENDPKHVRSTRTYIERVITLASIERIGDLSPSAVMRAIGSLKADGLSARALNAYLTAIKSFSRWLKRDGRTADYALETLSKFNEQADRRYIRRALTPEEAARVIQAAQAGPIVGGLSGPERAILYDLAFGTGFRADELATLTPERFALDADPPTVTALACYAKNGREAIQPISRSLADRLAPWLARKASRRPVFEGMTERTAEMLRVDLEAAGVPYETSEGVVDFHGTRVAYITNLVASGASVKTCQTLARHSTPALTIGVYAKAALHDVKGAVENLPDPAGSAAAEPLAMTGTDGCLSHRQPSDPIGQPALDARNSSPEGQPISERLSHYFPTGGVVSSRLESSPDVMAQSDVPASTNEKPLVSKGSDASSLLESSSVANAPRRTRTYNPLIKSQLLCQLS